MSEFQAPFTTRPFAASDLCLLRPQASQRADAPADPLAHGALLAAAGGRCVSIVDAQGRVALCGGAVATVGPHYWSAWSLIADGAFPRHTVPLTRRAQRFFEQILRDEPGIRRIDCSVHAGDTKALTWARFLGMLPETRLRRAAADGSDLIVCARFPEGTAA